MPLPRETLKTASPEGDTEDPQYPTHNGFMARRVQKAPHASPEGGTEDNSNTPLTKVLWLGGAYPMDGASRWAARCAAVLFRKRSTSPAPGYALRPPTPSVASFRCRLACARVSSVHASRWAARCAAVQALDVPAPGFALRPQPPPSTIRYRVPTRVGITLALRRAGAPARFASVVNYVKKLSR